MFDGGDLQVDLVSLRGALLDQRGEVVGYVRARGEVYDWRGRYAGYVGGDLDTPLKGGAALLLLDLARP